MDNITQHQYELNVVGKYASFCQRFTGPAACMLKLKELQKQRFDIVTYTIKRVE